jgi:hypothetical protein
MVCPTTYQILYDITADWHPGKRSGIVDFTCNNTNNTWISIRPYTEGLSGTGAPTPVASFTTTTARSSITLTATPNGYTGVNGGFDKDAAFNVITQGHIVRGGSVVATVATGAAFSLQANDTLVVFISSSNGYVGKGQNRARSVTIGLTGTSGITVNNWNTCFKHSGDANPVNDTYTYFYPTQVTSGMVSSGGGNCNVVLGVSQCSSVLSCDSSTCRTQRSSTYVGTGVAELVGNETSWFYYPIAPVVSGGGSSAFMCGTNSCGALTATGSMGATKLSFSSSAYSHSSNIGGYQQVGISVTVAGGGSVWQYLNNDYFKDSFGFYYNNSAAPNGAYINRGSQ